MAPKVNEAKRLGPSSNRNARNASIKKRKSLDGDDFDLIIQPSQSSSDDGMMATIAQQVQVSMEKKKREKETKFLQAAQSEFSKILADKTHDFVDGVAEIDKIYSDFQDAYASNEDHIRNLWAGILEEHLKLEKLFEEKYKASLDRENRREKEHIQALAHCRKACEESQRLIDSLV